MSTVAEKVHMIGIGGSGMSSIAKVLLQMGYNVSGSDLADSAVLRQLRDLGASIYIGHAPEQIDGATSVVISTAIDENNMELQEARRKNLPVFHRSEMLARLLNEKEGIAVAGAHGKTTITAMISLVLEKAGLDPTVIIGGQVGDLGGGAKFGRGKYLVAEADESDGSFLRYRPVNAIVTYVEADHLEHYGGKFSNLVDGYRQFLNNVKQEGKAILGASDPVLKELGRKVSCPVITYGFGSEADYRADHWELKPEGTVFEVTYRGKRLGDAALVVPGRHNVENALAAIAACREAGVPFADIAQHLQHFHGVHRRFEVVDIVDDIIIVDDYAHHPTEIAATLKAAREAYNRRVVAVFQPHRYSRTLFLMEEFSGAFGDADVVVLTDIYAPPPEKPIQGVSSEKLAILTEKVIGRPVSLIGKNELIDFLVNTARSGDIIILMGAGDIGTFGPSLAARLRNERLAAL